MDLQKSILNEHSKAQADAIVTYIGHDKARFARLMKLFLNGDDRTTQRAGWPVSICVARFPELAAPYYGKLLNYLDKPGIHPAIIRNIARLFQHTDIPKRYHGRLMDKCFGFISSVNAPIAVRAFSLHILQNMLIEYPEIKPELTLIIEENWEHATPAFRSRAKKILSVKTKPAASAKKVKKSIN